jgi:hypothetical protein
MGTFGKSKKTANKERNKSIAKGNIAKMKAEHSRLAKDDKEKILLDIADTKSRIKNVEADYRSMNNNKVIENKLNTLKLILINKQKELEYLENKENKEDENKQ